MQKAFSIGPSYILARQMPVTFASDKTDHTMAELNIIIVYMGVCVRVCISFFVNVHVRILFYTVEAGMVRAHM